MSHYGDFSWSCSVALHVVAVAPCSTLLPQKPIGGGSIPFSRTSMHIICYIVHATHMRVMHGDKLNCPSWYVPENPNPQTNLEGREETPPTPLSIRFPLGLICYAYPVSRVKVMDFPVLRFYG